MMRTSSSLAAICSRTRLTRASYSSTGNNIVVHPPWDQVRAFERPLSANLQNGQHVDPNHVDEVDDIDTFVGHGIVAPAWTADEAFHPAEIVKMTGVGAVKADQRNAARQL